LSINEPDRVKAKATIVAEVERLHWRIWNGKAKNAQRSIKRIGKVMYVFKGEHSQGARGVPSRKLWHACCRSRKVLAVNRIGQGRLHSCGALDNTVNLILVARGRKVTLCLAAREKLLTDGVAVRVVSMRSSELFEERDAAYHDGVPPSSATARG
jgi:hypothetical protein